jgi:hypothetical protein
MKKTLLFSALLLASVTVLNPSCMKEKDPAVAPYDLDVVLHGLGGKFGLGEAKAAGFIKFRQNPDAAKIINLDTWVKGLAPDHEYQLQRAVDAINVVDGECTSTTWLTLGLGLTAQSILTNAGGSGHEALWRDVTAVPSGSAFDIHFQVIDKATGEVVLTSDCLNYVVR